MKRILRTLLGVASVAALSACGSTNPCDGMTGECLAVRVEGPVTVDSLRFELSGAESYQKTAAAPSGASAIDLPAVVAITFGHAVKGALTVDVVGLAGGKTVGLGRAMATLDGMTAQQVTVTLAGVGMASCTDDYHDGDETGVDCGGSCPKCPDGQGCTSASDCMNGNCAAMVCAAATCSDSTQNQNESDVDCGGSCSPCDDGKKCNSATDCKSMACTAGICSMSSCSDHILNGNETDLDCGGSCQPCPDGKMCKVDGDCTSRVCTGGVCQAPSCTDGKKNGTETDVDCGGAACDAIGKTCAVGQGCGGNTDCKSAKCTSMVCQMSSCSDSMLDGDETDVDCGGSCNGCGTGLTCKVNMDCASLKCTDTKCAAPTCSDGIQNGGETGTDCGGPCDSISPAQLCNVGTGCSTGADCKEGVCTAQKCAAPTCSDKVKNGTETDVDCGGGSCNPCMDTQTCVNASDCIDKVCASPTHTCSAPTCVDGAQNGMETDVDCGGPSCAGLQGKTCADGKGCKVGSDCTDKVCGANMLCSAPTCSDNVQNGTETDTDCGGSCAPGKQCAVGQGCKLPGDCATGNCLNLKCAPVAPTVGNVTPALGPSTGGTPIVITGTNFPLGSGTVTVKVGANMATGVSVTDSTHIAATTPAGTYGKADVTVTTTDQFMQSATKTAGFSYYPGTVAFGTPKTTAVGAAQQALVVGDFNNDKKLDLAVTVGTSSVYVLLGDNTGAFANASNSPITVGSGPAGLATGKLTTNPGNLDLVVAQKSAGTVSSLIGSGTGTFPTKNDYAGLTTPVAVALADFNGDGKLDAAFNATSSKIIAYQGNGDGTLTNSFNPSSAGSTIVSLAVGDFDGKMGPDIVVANNLSATVNVCLNQTNFVFTTGQNFAAGTGPTQVVVGDFRKNGKLDVAVSNSGNDGTANDVSVLLGVGDGTFPATTKLSTGDAMRSLALDDVNLDGNLDIVAVGDAGKAYVFLGTGLGTFQSVKSFGMLTAPSFIATGDFNGDGLPDLAIASSGSNNVTVLLNTSQ